MIANKVTPKIAKTIKKFGVDVEVFRNTLNEFNEPVDKVKVIEFRGLFSESQHSINSRNIDSGQVKKDKTYKLIALINKDTIQLKENDILLIKEVEFKLININNANMLDTYFDLTLEKNNVFQMEN